MATRSCRPASSRRRRRAISHRCCLGRIGAPEDIAFDAFTQQTTETDSLTGGFSYDFSGRWQVKGYYQTGETDVRAIQRGGIRLDRTYLAADVVTDPLTGQPACNVTVTTRGTANPLYPDCVPLNLFGRNSASDAAIDWVTGFEPGVPINAQGFLSATESMPHSYVSGENKTRVIAIEQDVWEISADGQIAEGWAGPISMAAGYGFREESFTQVVEVGPGGNINADPRFRPVMANNAALGIRGVPGGALASTWRPLVHTHGDKRARHTPAPCARVITSTLRQLGRDPVLERAVRARRARRQGSVHGVPRSARQGAQRRPAVEPLGCSALGRLLGRRRPAVVEDGSRLGHHRSGAPAHHGLRGRPGGYDGREVRPNRRLHRAAHGLRDRSNASTYTATQFSNGSPDIKPEQAKTATFGIVYQPEAIENLSLSVDYFSVIIEDNIQQAGAQTVVTGRYQQNDAYLCSLITRGGAPSTENPAINYISLIGVPYYNQARIEFKGIDYEVTYRKNVDWFGGGEFIGVRFLGTYLDERTDINASGVKTSLEGTHGVVATPNTGLPERAAVITGNYNRDALSLSLSARYASSMLIQRTWNTGEPGGAAPALWDVTDNETDTETVLDARFDYRFDTANGSLNLFFNINDLLDSEPEDFLTSVYSSNVDFGTGPNVTGENRGRRYTLGVRMAF